VAELGKLPAAETVSAIELEELRGLLDEELHRLPERYRAPLILHYLEEKTVEQVAQELGWRPGTVSSRLARGKELLRVGLVRHGVTLSVGTAAAALAHEAARAALPPGLAQVTIQAATCFALPSSAPATSGSSAAQLAHGLLRADGLRRLRWLLVVLLSVGIAGAGLAMGLRQTSVGPARAPGRDPVTGLPGLRDAHGDPLPAGALLRLGTVRFRHGVGLSALASAPHGHAIASAGDNGLIRWWDAATGEPKGSLWLPGLSDIRSLAYAPDGRTLLAGGLDVARYPDSTVCLCDTDAGKILRTFSVPGTVMRCAFSPDGRWYAVADNNHTVLVWDAATGERRWQCEVVGGRPMRSLRPWPAVALAFSPDCKTLAAGGTAGIVRLWNLNDGTARQGPLTPRRLVTGPGAPRPPLLPTTRPEVRALAYSPDGTGLAIGDSAGNISLWDMQCMKETAVLPGFTNNYNGGVTGLSFSPDGKTLATSCADGTMVLTDIARGIQRLSLVVERPNLFLPVPLAIRNSIRHEAWRDPCFASDGALLLAGTPTGEILVWDSASGHRMHPNNAPQQGSCWVAVSPDGRTVAVASRQNAVTLWDAHTGEFLNSIGPHEGCCWTAFSPDGAQVLSGDAYDHCVRLWDRASGREVQELGRCEEVVFSPDAETLFQRRTPEGTEPRLLVHRRDGRLLWQVRADVVSPQGVLCAPDGSYVAYAQLGVSPATPDEPRNVAGVVFRDPSTGNELRFIPCNQGCHGIAHDPQGARLAIASSDGVRVWDTRTGRALCNLETLTPQRGQELIGYTTKPPEDRGGPANAIRPLAFSPDGRLLAAGSAANRITIWEVASGRVRLSLRGHESRVASLAFTPDGRRLISGSDDTTVLIWDVADAVEPQI
jgi:WD40 repeat protein